MNIHLESIKIPEFKVIKNLELTFQSRLIPRIYPVGGANGSGKSTMMELLFLLLHGAAKPELHEYIKNAIATIERIEDKQLTFLEANLIIGGCKLKISFYNLVEREIKGSFEDYRLHFTHNLYPIYFDRERNYVLWCSFDWDGESLNDFTIPKVLKVISDRVMFAVPSSYNLSFLMGGINRSRIDYAKEVTILEYLTTDNANFFDADRHELCGYLPMLSDLPLQIDRLIFWIVGNRKHDCIFLLDSIDLGLHPDNQYNLVRWLEQYAPQHQYIIATHSYELCTALTPAHVKEI